MGYYTDYRLEIIGEDSENVIKELRFQYRNAEYALTENGNSCEPARWYDYENDMRSFSIQYPKLIFKLYGEGDADGNTWLKYFKNGKMQYSKAIITYEPFDEGKLN